MGQDESTRLLYEGAIVIGHCTKRALRRNGDYSAFSVGQGASSSRFRYFPRINKGDYKRDLCHVAEGLVAGVSAQPPEVFLYDLTAMNEAKSFTDGGLVPSDYPSCCCPLPLSLTSHEHDKYVLAVGGWSNCAGFLGTRLQLYQLGWDELEDGGNKNLGRSQYVSSIRFPRVGYGLMGVHHNAAIEPNLVLGSGQGHITYFDVAAGQCLHHEKMKRSPYLRHVVLTSQRVVLAGGNGLYFRDLRTYAPNLELGGRFFETFQWRRSEGLKGILWDAAASEHHFVVAGSERICCFDLRDLGQMVWQVPAENPGAMTSISGGRFAVLNHRSHCCEFRSFSSGQLLHQTDSVDGKVDSRPVYIPPFDDPSLSVVDRNRQLFIDPNLVKRGHRIGRGGQGLVYRGRLKVGAQVVMEVAIKRFVVSRNPTEEERRTIAAADDLEHEIRLMVELTHENILKCYGCFFDEDDADPTSPTVNVVLEYCAGGDLEHWLHGVKEVITSVQKLQMLLQIARGLQHMHLKEIAHSDVALDNVLVTCSDLLGSTMKLCDFGLSNHFGSVQSLLDVGKPRYMPPSRSGEKRKIDVYAFGILGWEIWQNGQHAYSDIFERRMMNPLDKLEFIRRNHLRPEVSVCAGMPLALKDLLISCWSEEPADRPSFDMIVDELEEIIRNPVVEEEVLEREEEEEPEQAEQDQVSTASPKPRRGLLARVAAARSSVSYSPASKSSEGSLNEDEVFLTQIDGLEEEFVEEDASTEEDDQVATSVVTLETFLQDLGLSRHLDALRSLDVQTMDDLRFVLDEETGQLDSEILAAFGTERIAARKGKSFADAVKKWLALQKNQE